MGINGAGASILLRSWFGPMLMRVSVECSPLETGCDTGRLRAGDLQETLSSQELSPPEELEARCRRRKRVEIQDFDLCEDSSILKGAYCCSYQVF